MRDDRPWLPIQAGGDMGAPLPLCESSRHAVRARSATRVLLR
ncbi:hypothetical protein trd_A0005 (plasmid) [Thermomicrobium roseum DSM 5159]|uniref:Uncharacterized protein n=1 Tax=Thermomicrobium roseum (strain ATCC 27502 / DSM 5159 / P-2) TaxID=309801 RepID=B9L578_THERP|nr:hypothetical protein trd_A0005 [Thermomicrobium roseum DSM 5159]